MIGLVSLCALAACGELAPATPGCEEGAETGTPDPDCPPPSPPSGDPETTREASGDCRLGPRLGPGRAYGTLFGAGSQAGGACDLGGPDAFVTFAVGARSDLRVTALAQGFVPRVELRAAGCPGGTTLACGLEGEPAQLLDVAPGTELLVVVGIDPDDPALIGATAGTLSFELLLQATPVLSPGDLCEPAARGRCAAGSVCAAGEDDPVARCELVPGDACGGPLPSIFVRGDAEVELELPAGLADAHRHGCGGEGGVDLAVELDLDPDLLEPFDPGAEPELRIAAEGLGLALRAPWCAPEAELDCATADEGEVALPELRRWTEAGVRPLLFVDWPTGAVPEGTLRLSLELFEP